MNTTRLLLLLALFSACSKNDDDTPSYPNLIVNGDFEAPLTFAPDGWTAVGPYTNYQRVPSQCPDGGQSMLALNRGNGPEPLQTLYYNVVVPQESSYGMRLSIRFRYGSDTSALSVGIIRKIRTGGVNNLGIFDLVSPKNQCLDFSSVFTQSWLVGDTAQVQLSGTGVVIDDLELRRIE